MARKKELDLLTKKEKSEEEPDLLSVNSQLHICLEIINDIVTSDEAEFIPNFRNCFVETGSEKKFQQILAEYRSDILPLVVEEYDTMSHSEKTMMSVVNELLCGLHLNGSLAHQTKNDSSTVGKYYFWR